MKIPPFIREWFFYILNSQRNGLTPKALLDQAERKTGFSDWGDWPFLEPMTVLLDALHREAQLNYQGKFVLAHHYHRLLTNLLKLVEDWKRNPEIASVPLCPPIYVVGFPRTGTTYLHRLLSLNPAHRSLQYWELLFPSPPPDPTTYARDSRIRMAKLFVRGLDFLSPQLSSIHCLNPTGAEECCFIFDHFFLDHIHHLVFDVPSYIQWYHRHDPLPSYRFHRRMLQHFAWKFSFERFVLKAPRHLFCLDTLLTVYPDAHIVWTHRDPCVAIPSLCSLSETARRIVSDQVDPRRIGQLCVEYFEKDYEAGMRARRKAGLRQIYDVQYCDLIQDPLGTVRKIYDHFGFPFTEDYDEKLRQQQLDQSPDRPGRHGYSLERYSLGKDEIQARLHDYRKNFLIRG